MTALATTTPLAVVQPHGLGTAQIDLIKRTIAQGATDDELALFVNVCNRTGLDPFAQQIHAVKRWDKKANREVMAIQTGIAGFRLIADRACAERGAIRSEEPTLYIAADGTEHKRWLSTEHPAAVEYTVVIVYPNGLRANFSNVALWTEYAQTNKEGKLIGQWPSMPALMLAKCAEAGALRKAFPQELSGLYTSDEMGQADNPHPDAIDVDGPVTEKWVKGWFAKANEVKVDDETRHALVLYATGRTTHINEVRRSEANAVRDALAAFMDGKLAVTYAGGVCQVEAVA